MSDYLLDTNVVSELICRRPNARVIDWLNSQPKESLYLSVVSVGELWRGFVLAPDARCAQLEQWFERELLPRVQSRILPVTQAIAKRWGILDADARLAE